MTGTAHFLWQQIKSQQRGLSQMNSWVTKAGQCGLVGLLMSTLSFHLSSSFWIPKKYASQCYLHWSMLTFHREVLGLFVPHWFSRPWHLTIWRWPTQFCVHKSLLICMVRLRWPPPLSVFCISCASWKYWHICRLSVPSQCVLRMVVALRKAKGVLDTFLVVLTPNGASAVLHTHSRLDCWTMMHGKKLRMGLSSLPSLESDSNRLWLLRMPMHASWTAIQMTVILLASLGMTNKNMEHSREKELQRSLGTSLMKMRPTPPHLLHHKSWTRMFKLVLSLHHSSLSAEMLFCYSPLVSWTPVASYHLLLWFVQRMHHLLHLGPQLFHCLHCQLISSHPGIQQCLLRWISPCLLAQKETSIHSLIQCQMAALFPIKASSCPAAAAICLNPQIFFLHSLMILMHSHKMVVFLQTIHTWCWWVLGWVTGFWRAQQVWSMLTMIWTTDG